MYLETAEEEEGGISNGTVVAYGKRITPPYFVKLEDDTIWINDQPYSPRREDPDRAVIEIEITNLDRQKHNLIDSIGISCLELFEFYTSTEAQNRILQEYGDHPLIGSMEFVGDIPCLHIEFKDGDEENLMIPFSLGDPETPEDLTYELSKEIKLIKNILLRGGMIIFDYFPPVHMLPSRKAMQIYGIIKDVKNKKISKSEAKAALTKIITHRHSERVIENLETWD